MKIIITESQYNFIRNHLYETIHPSEAYRDTDAINTVINGKRNVCFISPMTKEIYQIMHNAGLKTIHVGGFKDKAYVVYNENGAEQANRLAKIAKKNGGYLPINTPEETYEIGILLGYDKQAVIDFVMHKFPHTKSYFNT